MSNTTRKPRATKAEMAERRAKAAQQKVHMSMMPGIVAERHRLYAERLAALGKEVADAGVARICNAAMRGKPYRTGDGEVVQQVRPGSMVAYGLPSRGNPT